MMRSRVLVALLPVLCGCHFIAGHRSEQAPVDAARDASADRIVDGDPRLDVASPAEGLAPDAQVVGFAHRLQITIAAGRCAADLPDFPLLVSIAGDNLRTKANGGRVLHPEGYDIVFADADGISTLDFEVEAYDGAAGTLVAWVRVPLLSSSSDTVLYLRYGNGEIVAPTERPSDVWKGYAGVWHLGESSGVRADSTSSGNDVAEVPALPTVSGSVDAIAAGSAAFSWGDRTRLVIDDASQTGLDVTGTLTISFWTKAASAPGGWRNIVAKWESGDGLPAQEYSYYVASTSYLDGHRIKFVLEDASAQMIVWGTSKMELDGWYHVAAVYDGVQMSVYLDGSLDSVPVQKFSGARASATELSIGGKKSAPDFGHDGLLDEVRIAPRALPPDRLLCEYTNQVSPGTFFSVGGEEPDPD